MWDYLGSQGGSRRNAEGNARVQGSGQGRGNTSIAALLPPDKLANKFGGPFSQTVAETLERGDTTGLVGLTISALQAAFSTWGTPAVVGSGQPRCSREAERAWEPSLRAPTVVSGYKETHSPSSSLVSSLSFQRTPTATFSFEFWVSLQSHLNLMAGEEGHPESPEQVQGPPVGILSAEHWLDQAAAVCIPSPQSWRIRRN